VKTSTESARSTRPVQAVAFPRRTSL